MTTSIELLFKQNDSETKERYKPLIDQNYTEAAS